jgi:starch synthase
VISQRPLTIWMLASEMAPFARTGGLGEVLGSLPPALGRLGLDVTVVLPKYAGIDGGTPIDQFDLELGGDRFALRVLERRIDERVRALFIDCPALYDRPSLYGEAGHDFPDNPRRFALLVRAAFEHAIRHGVAPSVVHAHDWHAALAPVYLKTRYRTHPLLGGVPCILTIHNLAYQGIFTPGWLPRLDLDPGLFTVERLEYWHQISFLKGGVVFADLVTTVSPTYAREIQTPEYGFGFDGILRTRAESLVGILNGIDTVQWDPSHDPFLPATYSAGDLSGKAACKQALLEAFGLPVDAARRKRPVIGMVTRLVDQKGMDLLAAIGDELAQIDATYVLLGSGMRSLEDRWQGLAARYPDRIRVRLGFDDRLAHLIEAGSDLFLMPSRFEPCGLNQMYSLRYGTPPIVRATGGLADTVRPEGMKRRGTGFTFKESTAEAVLGAIGQAVAAFGNRRSWPAMQRRAMAEDHSWEASARAYVRVYDRVLKRKDTKTHGGRAGADVQ